MIKQPFNFALDATARPSSVMPAAHVTPQEVMVGGGGVHRVGKQEHVEKKNTTTVQNSVIGTDFKVTLSGSDIGNTASVSETARKKAKKKKKGVGGSIKNISNIQCILANIL